MVQGLPEVGTVVAVDVMDDGSPIRLAVTIDRRDGTAVFDFEGTGEALCTHSYSLVFEAAVQGVSQVLEPQERHDKDEQESKGRCVLLRFMHPFA